MKPERWRRIEEIFNSAIDLEPAQREIFLGKACAGDDALRKEVDRLLGGEKGAKGFIESPAIEVAARVLSEERKGGSAAGADTIPSTTEQPCTGRSIRELEREVAIKLIHPHLVASQEAAARFRQEAKAAASFAHPNVVTVSDYGMAEDRRAYLVMELLRGSTLRQELHRDGRLSPERAVSILSGVCAAVAAAHGRLILHRDLKPENIFPVKSDGSETAKILDFGVVKFLTQSDETVSANQTEPGRLIGTLKYMSPEELKGEKPSQSWNLWALAVVAYEMLAGVHPFTGSTSAEIRIAILDGRLTPLQTHLPNASASLQHFFDSALGLNPASRPKSALQLLYDFEQIIK